MENETRLFPLRLQFFAEDGGEGSNDDAGAAGTEGEGNQNPDAGKGGEAGETFTQEQMNAIAAREKSQGKNAILKLFGAKDEKTAKEQAKAFKEWQEAQKTNEQKLQDQQKDISDANARAQAAEDKLVCIMAGINKDSVDDALAIASMKVTEDKNLEAVIEDMKKEPRYKGFFDTDSSDSSDNKHKGTGTPAGHQGTGSSAGGSENIGERLGKARNGGAKKSNFFTN